MIFKENMEIPHYFVKDDSGIYVLTTLKPRDDPFKPQEGVFGVFNFNELDFNTMVFCPDLVIDSKNIGEYNRYIHTKLNGMTSPRYKHFNSAGGLVGSFKFKEGTLEFTLCGGSRKIPRFLFDNIPERIVDVDKVKIV